MRAPRDEVRAPETLVLAGGHEAETTRQQLRVFLRHEGAGLRRWVVGECGSFREWAGVGGGLEGGGGCN